MKSSAAFFFVILSLPALAVPVGESEPAQASSPAGFQAAEAQIRSFKHDPSLKVSLEAAEPLLANGVAFSQDEKGRWYIAETFRQEKGVEDNRVHLNWLGDDIASRSTADRTWR